MPRMIFHIGAHKTATTYIQNKLEINRDLLIAHNIHYPDIFETRKNFTYRMSQQPGEFNDFTQSLIAIRGQKTIILSDENMAGGVDDMVANDRQYQHIGKRMAKYCALLGVDDPEIYFAIRDYSSFVISLYCEYVRHYPFIKFEHFYARFKISKFSWPQVVGDLLSELPDAQVKIWDFGRFRQSEAAIVSDMVGFDSLELTPLTEEVRSSFSQLAIRSIEALSEVLDQTRLKHIAPIIAKGFPRNDEYKAFNPLGVTETADLTGQYLLDLDRLATLSANVRILVDSSI